jgi:hypothetical protein
MKHLALTGGGVTHEGCVAVGALLPARAGRRVVVLPRPLG